MVLTYHENPLTPGRVYFDCDRLKARLCVDTCAGMWRAENIQSGGDRGVCRHCPVGAEHAGEMFASTSNLAGSSICARCHKPAQRLICGMVCVSCKNREYELVRGSNAKGTRPVKLTCLSRRRVRFTSGGEPCTLSAALTLDSDELIIAALRDSKKTVRFAFAGMQPPTIPQLRLF